MTYKLVYSLCFPSLALPGVDVVFMLESSIRCVFKKKKKKRLVVERRCEVSTKLLSALLKSAVSQSE